MFSVVNFELLHASNAHPVQGSRTIRCRALQSKRQRLLVYVWKIMVDLRFEKVLIIVKWEASYWELASQISGLSIEAARGEITLNRKYKGNISCSIP